MARMPTVPDDWFADGQDGGMKPLPLAPLSDPPVMTNLPYRPDQQRGTGLTLLMEPHELASIEGLPAHIREGLGDLVDQRVRQEAGYVPTLGQVSLAQADYAAGPHPSNTESGAVAPADDKLERAAKVAGAYKWANTGWDAANRVVGGVLGLGNDIDRVGEYSKWAGRVLEPLQNGLEAQAAVEKGAPKLPTYTGATVKTVGGLAGAEAGAAMLGELGAPFLPPWGGIAGTIGGGLLGGLAPDVLFRKKSDAQIGGEIGRAYADYVRNDPWAAFP